MCKLVRHNILCSWYISDPKVGKKKSYCGWILPYVYRKLAILQMMTPSSPIENNPSHATSENSRIFMHSIAHISASHSACKGDRLLQIFIAPIVTLLSHSVGRTSLIQYIHLLLSKLHQCNTFWYSPKKDNQTLVAISHQGGVHLTPSLIEPPSIPYFPHRLDEVSPVGCHSYWSISYHSLPSKYIIITKESIQTHPLSAASKKGNPYWWKLKEMEKLPVMRGSWIVPMIVMLVDTQKIHG